MDPPDQSASKATVAPVGPAWNRPHTARLQRYLGQPALQVRRLVERLDKPGINHQVGVVEMSRTGQVVGTQRSQGGATTPSAARALGSKLTLPASSDAIGSAVGPSSSWSIPNRDCMPQ